MQVVLYEDGRHRSFGPLACLRPVFALRCGALRLHEKLECRRRGWRVLLSPRPALADVFAGQFPGRGTNGLVEEPTVLLSAGAVADEALLKALETASGETVLLAAGVPVGARVERDVRKRVEALRSADGDVGALGLSATAEVPARVVSYPWDLVRLTPDEIAADAEAIGRMGEIRGSVHPGAHLVEPGRIAIGDGSTIAPGAVIDATAGPVLIGNGATVMANAVVIGPAAIGDGSSVKVGAKIYGGTSIGPVCKVGGEVEGSVFQSHTNKQHDGFLGHSYLASWVNIGAATDNSDLKNNYGNVRVEIAGEVRDTGLTFVGATIGDHSKTAIGTKLTTGTVIGVFCNVLAAGFAPKVIPAFSWGGPDGFTPYEIEKALDTARRVVARRGERLTPAEESLIRGVFDEERRARAA
jgi:UDP-N-acetylglucosamine diphosphorylase/glucosamine-1-phosphate N-acetyltransferase